jgi:glycosyltransferase involved in cell wall biosynthesis
VEAMQAGVPVIASDHPALRETGGDAAIYFDAEKPEGLYEQCLRLYKDEQLKKQLIDAGYQQAARFSWRATAIALNELLQITGAAKE